MMTATFLCLFVLGGETKAKGPSLGDLQHAYAMNHFEPAPHMMLAKYHHDHGNRLLAFYILETARRTRFEAKAFDAAFDEIFRGKKPFDNSKEAEKKLLARHQQDQKHADTLFDLADIYVSRADWKNAKDFLKNLIAVKPEVYENYEALAEVLRQEGNEKAAAEIKVDFFTKHPESVEAYAKKIDPLMRNEPAKAKVILDEALKKHPKYASFWFNDAVLLQNADRLNEAEAMFVKAADLGKQNGHIQGWVARFFLRARDNEVKSLHYYLNVYFLDPHFRDTEYAEGRIRKLNYDAASAIVEKAQKDGKINELLSHKNPVVASLALVRLAKPWDVKNRKYLVEAMGHDDMTLRRQAVGIMMKNHDEAFDLEIRAMLAGKDLRKKGLACYLAVELWKDKGLVAVRPMLEENAQLVRFDAISALSQHGGAEGKKIMREHRKKEKNPWLIKMLDSLDNEK